MSSRQDENDEVLSCLPYWPPLHISTVLVEMSSIELTRFTTDKLSFKTPKVRVRHKTGGRIERLLPDVVNLLRVSLIQNPQATKQNLVRIRKTEQLPTTL